MIRKIPKIERRTLEQLREHYEFEKQLANQLRNASKEERQILYNTLYNELFHFFMNNPHLKWEKNLECKTTEIHSQISFLKKFLTNNSEFLEIGPGDCHLSFEVAKYVKKVYAIDVCTEYIKTIATPKNFEFIISDGCNIPVLENSINIAYSNQLMEHLHPDDAFDQLQNIYKALVPGGLYICITPNFFVGPSDISQYFDEVATGFHLKEYTVQELHALFRKVGFLKIVFFIGGKGKFLKFPLFPIELLEKILCFLPFSYRKKITDIFLFQALLGIKIVGVK